jgi:hypothetical protein
MEEKNFERFEGTTTSAIKIAMLNEIPIFNLGKEEDLNRILKKIGE